MSVKIDRINSELQKRITKIISCDIKDPRINGSIVGVTRVDTTPDLKFAKVFLSIISKSDEDKKEVFDTVVRSRVFIRNMLKNEMQIRLIPELTFVIDNSCEYGIKIDKILSEIVIPPVESDNDSE